MKYRESSADRHYRVDIPQTRQTVIEAFASFLAQDNKWRTMVEWRREKGRYRRLSPYRHCLGVVDVAPLIVFLHDGIPELVLHGARSKARILKDWAEYL